MSERGVQRRQLDLSCVSDNQYTIPKKREITKSPLESGQGNVSAYNDIAQEYLVFKEEMHTHRDSIFDKL